MFHKLLREPFVHFVLLGAAIFVLYELTAATSRDQQDTIIRLDRGDIEQLREEWSRLTGKEADPDTLEELLEEQVREEVLYREALRLGLDSNDTIVRRRLVQKMDFITANMASLQAPSEKVLLEWYAGHREDYREEEKRSFAHIYFSHDRRGETVLDDAGALLAGLRDTGQTSRQSGQGDNFILQYDYRQREQWQVAQVFGKAFAEALFAMQAGSWQGPVLSEYGAHLVFVKGITPSHVPDFARIRQKVSDDYLQQQLQTMKSERYAKLRSNYRIEIDREED